MSSSNLSTVSAETAVSFDEEDLAPEWTDVIVAIDDFNLQRKVVSRYESSYQYEHFLIYVAQTDAAELKPWRHIYMSVTTEADSEWFLLVQLRIKTGENASVLNVVDKDVFRFDSFTRPLSVELQTTEVKFLKLEMRVLNTLYLEHPRFLDGDTLISFEDGPSIRVYKHILYLLSDYMDEFEKQSSHIQVSHIPRKAFLELLYQAYPTRRPIYGNFRSLSLAAVGLRCNSLINHLSRHIVEFNSRPLSFEERFRAAIDNQLAPAIQEIAFRAARDGTWDRLIQKGFEAESFCGKSVYTQLVCPAIIKGRRAGLDDTLLKEDAPVPDFLSKDPNDDSKSAILFRGTTFYMNSGLLAAHGRQKFSIGRNEEYIAIYSLDFQNECGKMNLLPGEVLLSVLHYMMPLGPMPQAEMLRAAIVFCHDHEWNILKEDLEQELLHEPPLTVIQYMSQLKFAEKYGLVNMLRTNVQRAEASCHQIANHIVASGQIDELQKSTSEAIVDRMCSGWGLHPSVNRLATRMPTKFTERCVELERGSVLARGPGRLCDTLVSMQSEYAFGMPTEMVVVD
ncbi:unnamed protein product [Caenorhabditis auriculariae]|uniref:DUF7754 domain-containing protein n=1 Tax=Caenorhabditis auriculariae TaxID=2777116 RepID=A0A8S1HKB5_9PELO|nr:unnamed protein product [Caenorhabditis auriculariae]